MYYHVNFTATHAMDSNNSSISYLRTAMVHKSVFVPLEQRMVIHMYKRIHEKKPTKQSTFKPISLLLVFIVCS